MKDVSGKKLLIVDDEPDLREVLALQFEHIGLETIEAGNGIEALEALEKGGIDGILSDIRMPKMDGKKLLQEVREKYGNTLGLVFVTGFADLSESEAFAWGADGYVKKPYDRDQLSDAVTSIFYSSIERLDRKPEATAEINLEVKIEDLGADGNAKNASFGRGGVFIRLPGPRIPHIGALINLKLQFSDGPLPSFEGIVVQRWARNEPHASLGPGAGFEFLYVSESCRTELAEFLESLNSRAFIPDRIPE